MDQGQVRRQSREVALQALFHVEFFEGDPADAVVFFHEHFQTPPEVWDYAKGILMGIFTNKDEIDAMIESQSAHWRLHRMAVVDRNLLRIAVFEIHYSQGAIPPKVAMNEAIEISRKYGNTDSPSFINGLLDQIARRVP